jgi:transcriptional regulator with XRE-family HTH domain
MSKKPVPVDALVGHNIQICRRQRGLSQAELGERIGVSFQQVQKYENGTNRVGASRLTLIADALGVPLANLFEGSSTADRPDPGPDPSGRALLAKPHALRLAQAFDRIARKPTRIAVVHLVEAIAEVQVSPPRVRPRSKPWLRR